MIRALRAMAWVRWRVLIHSIQGKVRGDGLERFGRIAELLTQLDVAGSKYAAFLAVEEYPRVIRDWIFDIDTVDYLVERSGFEQWTAVPATLVVVLLATTIVWARYRRLP